MTVKKAIKQIDKLASEITKTKIPQRLSILETKIQMLKVYIDFKLNMKEEK